MKKLIVTHVACKLRDSLLHFQFVQVQYSCLVSENEESEGVVDARNPDISDNMTSVWEVRTMLISY